MENRYASDYVAKKLEELNFRYRDAILKECNMEIRGIKVSLPEEGAQALLQWADDEIRKIKDITTSRAK